MLLKVAWLIVSYWFEQMNYTYKNIWLIAFPVMMSILIEQLINITDALFLGHVVDVELGASALAGIWFLAIYMLGFGFSLGLQVIIARRNGEQRYSETGKTFFQGFSFLLSLAAVLCLLSQTLSPILLKHLIISDDVYNAVIRYLDGRIWGLFFSFPFLALRSFLVGITQAKALNMAAFTAVLVNIPMNWLLIFGFDMGISGAAIASSFAELCSLIVLTVYMFLHINRHLYGLHWSIDITVLKEVFSISVWSMFQFFMSVAIWFLFFLAIERLGETELAVSNIIRSVSALFAVIVNALSGVTSSLVSNLIGAGEKRNVFPLCHRIIRLGYAAGVPLIVLALLFHQSIIGAYTDNPDNHTGSMATVCGHAVKLLLCVTRLCLSECRNRDRSDPDSLHFSSDNYDCLPVLFMGTKPLECSIGSLLDSRISVRDIARCTIRFLSEIQTILKAENYDE